MQQSIRGPSSLKACRDVDQIIALDIPCKDTVWFDNIHISDSEILCNKNKTYLIWYNGGSRIDVCLTPDIKPKEYLIRVTKEKFHSNPFPNKIESILGTTGGSM